MLLTWAYQMQNFINFRVIMGKECQLIIKIKTLTIAETTDEPIISEGSVCTVHS